MQKDIAQVIGEHRIAPELLFEPEEGVDKWIILLRGAGLEPNASQSS